MSGLLRGSLALGLLNFVGFLERFSKLLVS